MSCTPGELGEGHSIVLAVVSDPVGLLCDRSPERTAIVIEDGLTWAALTEGAERCLTSAERDLLRDALGLPLLPAALPDPAAVARLPEMRTPQVVIMHIDLAVPWPRAWAGEG